MKYTALIHLCTLFAKNIIHWAMMHTAQIFWADLNIFPTTDRISPTLISSSMEDLTGTALLQTCVKAYAENISKFFYWGSA